MVPGQMRLHNPLIGAACRQIWPWGPKALPKALGGPSSCWVRQSRPPGSCQGRLAARCRVYFPITAWSPCLWQGTNDLQTERDRSGGPLQPLDTEEDLAHAGEKVPVGRGRPLQLSEAFGPPAPSGRGRQPAGGRDPGLCDSAS